MASSSSIPEIPKNKPEMEFQDAYQLETYLKLKELSMSPTFYIDPDDFVMLQLSDEMFWAMLKTWAANVGLYSNA